MKKILIFGATGNLGSYTVDYLWNYLNKKEYEIIAIGRKDTDFFSRYGICYIKLDVTNEDDFAKLPTRDVYAVVNLIGVMPSHTEGFHPYPFVDVNVRGTLNILEYCRKKQVDRILFTQTESDLAGHWGKEFVIKPNLPRKLILSGNYAIYTITKSAAVDLIESYWLNFGLKRFVFRLPNIYLYKPNCFYFKDGQKTYESYRYLIKQAIAGDPIELWGDPSLARDIVYVKDFTQMVFKAIEAQCNGGMYNAGSGTATTFQKQVEGIVDIFCPKNKKSQIIYCPEKTNSRTYLMDIENARCELGYEPQYSYLDYLMDFKREMELKRFDELLSH